MTNGTGRARVSAPAVFPSIAQHAIADDCLQLGGESISRLADGVGKTPFYAYSQEFIAQRVATLRRHLPSELAIHYAVKANPMRELVNALGKLVDGFDVASSGELALALDTGMKPGQVSFAGPGKRDAELRAAISAGVVINVESESELERIHLLGRALEETPRVALRVNPDFALRASGIKMSGAASPFGIDEERIPEVLQRCRGLDVGFHGFQVFAGSQCLSHEALAEVQTRTFALAYRLAEQAPVPPATLNIGGAFGIPYFPKDEPLDLPAVGAHLEGLMREAHGRLPSTQIILELGRYVVGEAGIYVCRVVDRKVSRDVTYLVTDGGLHQHLAATGNFGQVIRRNFPVLLAHRVHGGPREIVSIVGPSCTPLDVIADQAELGVAEVGDLIVILQSGAYGLSASPIGFLSHPPPVEVLV